MSEPEGIVVHQLSSQKLPLVVEPRVPGTRLEDWGRDHSEFIETRLVETGGLLFRGFQIDSPEQFEAAVAALCHGALEYSERSSPRRQVVGNVYTSTEHPKTQSIFLHNEQSYNLTFPRKILFYCHKPASRGGQTPVADCRRVLEQIDPGVRARFEERGYRYVRTFHRNYGLSWQDAFCTERKEEVESYCEGNGITCEWRSNGLLRTEQIRRVVATHPVSGERTWFNHLTFFHISTLSQPVKDFLLSAFGADELPNNTYYGDGEPIEESVMEHLREIYQRETVTFDWKRGDVLLLDNMLTAHGRAPFEGERSVLVGMSEPTSWSSV